MVGVVQPLGTQQVEASLPVMVLKARALLGLGQHDQASKIASLVLRQEPHNVEALFVRGKVSEGRPAAHRWG